MRKIFVFMFIMVLTVALFSQTKVTLWHSYRGEERTAINQTVQRFNQNRSDIKIEVLAVPFDAFPDKITAAVPRGKGPDIFIFAHDRIGGWVEGGILEPIDFYLEEGIEDKFVEGAFGPMHYDGSVYGLPMSLKSVVLFYNANLIDSPPQTTDEMIRLAKHHTNVSEGKYGLVYEIANFYYHAAWLQGFGGRIFDENNLPVLNSEENIRSFQFAQDLFQKEKIVPPEVSNVLVTTLFNEGRAAMVINGPWFRGEIDDKIPYEVALLPIISETETRATPFMSSEGVLMSTQSKNKDASYEVMEYLISDEVAMIMARVGKQPVAIQDVYQHPDIANDKYLPIFKQQILHSRPMPSIPQMTFVWSPATTAINATINGRDPKTELDNAQRRVMQNLQAAGMR
jgi:arabinogalactan oligomer/maltooligosaccharide transport system substrate-binding protein